MSVVAERRWWCPVKLPIYLPDNHDEGPNPKVVCSPDSRGENEENREMARRRRSRDEIAPLCLPDNS